MTRAGITSVTEISNWQVKVSEAFDDDEKIEGICKEIKNKHSTINLKKIENFLRNRKLKIVRTTAPQELAPPEEVVMAVKEIMAKNKTPFIIGKMDSDLGYENIKNALRLLTAQLNERITIPTQLKLPFLITAEEKLKGIILTKLSETKKTVTLVRAVASQNSFRYVFFGEKVGKGANVITQFSSDFYMYKFQSEGNKEYILLSTDELDLSQCIVTGMKLVAYEALKIGEIAKIPSTVPILFVHTQLPEIRQIAEEECKRIVSKYADYEALAKDFFGEYRHPEWFEKIILAWIFSAKYSGYPLHIGLLSPPGVGKSYLLEGLSKVFGEQVASGSTSTLLGLIPSYGKGKIQEGYLARCKRFGFVDEFFATLKRSMRNSGDIDSGTYLMLELLEHNQRPSLSGFGKITVNPRMKVFLVSNNESYRKLRTIVDAVRNLMPAFMSRILWYEVTPSHTDFINERKPTLQTADKDKAMPKYNPELVELVDYFSRVRFDMKPEVLTPIVNSYVDVLPSELISTIYTPRAIHHLVCLIDGFAKLNYILEKREKLEVTKKDIEEAGIAFGNFVTSWAQEVNLLSIPEKNRILYLKRTDREIFEFIQKNQGMRTPDIRLHMGEVYHILVRLKELKLLQTVLDKDGTTDLWFTFDAVML